jgi:hypothetical protein
LNRFGDGSIVSNSGWYVLAAGQRIEQLFSIGIVEKNMRTCRLGRPFLHECPGTMNSSATATSHSAK